MFTGIIQAIGNITEIEDRDVDKRFKINAGKLDLSDLKTGESIAVNGTCLTIIELFDAGFYADVSGETLSCTTFCTLDAGSRVNLEKALQLSSRLDGHLVSGHIDAVGTVKQRSSDGRSEQYVFDIPDELQRYVCKKGSISVDGVSLTVNDVNGASFSVNIIPHTLQETTFADYTEGDRVNIEVDIIARYLDSLFESSK